MWQICTKSRHTRFYRLIGWVFYTDQPLSNLASSFGWKIRYFIWIQWLHRSREPLLKFLNPVFSFKHLCLIRVLTYYTKKSLIFKNCFTYETFRSWRKVVYLLVSSTILQRLSFRSFPSKLLEITCCVLKTWTLENGKRSRTVGKMDVGTSHYWR